MAAAGVFALLQAYAFLQYLRDRLTKQEFQTLFFLGVSLAAGAVFLSVIYLTYTGYIAPWSGRFYSLWDTGYAKIHIPIIASVSEHQPTTWVSFFFDLHILVCTFPAGLWFCIIAIVPGYISRSVAGSFDNEGIAIFALQFTYYLWVKSVKTGSVFWTMCCCLSYFYMVSAWGGYVFIINLIPLHVFVLLLMQRYSKRVYIAYSTFYIVGLILSMQIPFVGFQPIRTSEHMAAAGMKKYVFSFF